MESLGLCLPRSVSGHCQYQRAESTKSNGYLLQLLGSLRVFVFVLINARSKLNYCAMSHVTHSGELLLPDCYPSLAQEIYLL